MGTTGSGGALAFFAFVDEHRAAWRGLLASGSAPLTAEMAGIRRRQARLVAGLLIEPGPSGTASAADALTTAAQTADALANAINGAFEALAGWWQDNESMSAHDLTELMVNLVGPGLDSFAGLTAGPKGAHR